MKVVLAKFSMFMLWGLTLSTSLYLTAQRSVLSETELHRFIILLIVFGVLSTVFSYLYLKFLSPISTIQENVDDLIDDTDEEE